jgi:hypothetical protein
MVGKSPTIIHFIRVKFLHSKFFIVNQRLTIPPPKNTLKFLEHRPSSTYLCTPFKSGSHKPAAKRANKFTAVGIATASRKKARQ